MLVHTPTGPGSPQKNFKDKYLKFGLKLIISLSIWLMSAYNFGISGNNLTKLFHVTCRGQGLWRIEYLNTGRAESGDRNL